MKKCYLFLPVLLLLLTGCQSKATDIAKSYRDYLAYAFGEDCTIEEQFGDSPIRTWLVTYTDKSGSTRTAELASYPYGGDDGDRHYGSHQEYDDVVMHGYMSIAMGNAIRQELIDTVLSEHFDLDFSDEPLTLIDHGDGYSVSAHGVAVYSADDVPYAWVQEDLTADSGWAPAECDLPSAAQSKEFYVIVRVTVDEDVDPAPYQEQLEQAYQDFLEVTGKPMHYQFELKQKTGTDTNNSELIFSRCAVFGETFDRNDKPEDYKFSEDIRNRLLEQ